MARILLPPDIQRNLCLTARDNLGYSTWSQLAKYLMVNVSTLGNWYQSIQLLPDNIYAELVKVSGLDIKPEKLLPDNWGAVKGGMNNIAKHGKSFWTLEGSILGGSNSAKKVIKPSYSEDLAEFVGIMLGDGGVSKSQISITLGFTSDREYTPYVIKLIYDLFEIKASTYAPNNHNFIRIRACGVNLVKHLLRFGLIQGNKIKQQFDIPAWIKEEDSYIKACIRGLIDTDGCIHRKVRRDHNGFEYRSIGITLSSASKPLQLSFINLFKILGFKVAISGTTIYLCGKVQVRRYIEEIGFSNPKHLYRYQTFLQNHDWVKVKTENCLS